MASSVAISWEMTLHDPDLEPRPSARTTEKMGPQSNAMNNGVIMVFFLMFQAKLNFGTTVSKRGGFVQVEAFL